ncbi:MAG: amidohydrolase family protein, partial [bacterium]|nr:amidohydrolase family protein [bacterium]
MRRPVFLASLALLLLVLTTACSRRTIYLGAPILTVDADNRVAEALGIEGDRIGAVGNENEVRAWAGPAAQVIELEGGAIVPGFIDAHGHFPGDGVWAGVTDLNPPPIGDLETIDQLVARMRERAENTAAGEWVTGMGYDDTLLAERRHPTRHDLDRVATDRPVIARHVSGHLAVANTHALALIGIDRDSVAPEGGVIRREADGQPDGVLEETAMFAAFAKMPS